MYHTRTKTGKTQIVRGYRFALRHKSEIVALYVVDSGKSGAVLVIIGLTPDGYANTQWAGIQHYGSKKLLLEHLGRSQALSGFKPWRYPSAWLPSILNTWNINTFNNPLYSQDGE